MTPSRFSVPETGYSVDRFRHPPPLRAGMSPRTSAEDAYAWVAGQSIAVRIWIITLVGGLLAIPLTSGASIALFVAGALTGLIAHVMYN